MAHPVSIRLARHTDLGDAVDVWRESNTFRGKPPNPGRVARVRGKLAHPSALVLVAVLDTECVGMALAEPGRDDDGAGRPLPWLCHISMVFVRPQHWGRRIGQLLLDEIAKRAAKGGRSHLQVWTGERNHRAQRLYQRARFRPTGRTGHLPTGERIHHLMRPLASGQTVTRDGRTWRVLVNTCQQPPPPPGSQQPPPPGSQQPPPPGSQQPPPPGSQ